MGKQLTSRQKQAIEMKEKIQETAMRLFNDKGFTAVSMENIAQEAGCSVGNIYNYFKTKDELSVAMTDNVDMAYAEIEKTYAKDKKGRAMDHLLDFVEQTLKISANDRMLYPCFIHSIKYPESGLLKIKPERTYFRMLKDLLSKCVEEGSISSYVDLDELVHRLVVIHRGLLIEWRIDEGAFDLQKEGRQIVEAIIRGL